MVDVKYKNLTFKVLMFCILVKVEANLKKKNNLSKQSSNYVHT